MKNLHYLVLLFTAIALTSCGESDTQCWEIMGTGVTLVEGETQTTVNTPLDLTVHYRVFNNCGNFYTFFEEISEGIKWITVNLKYEGCECDSQLRIETETYTFIGDNPGEYVLRFKMTNSEFIEKVIVVTP